MALLQEEVWIKDFQDTLNLDASALSRMTDLTEFATKHMIHFPNAGALTKTLSVNNTTFPLTPEQREDSMVNIPIDQYTTKPVLITELESYQLSAPKRNSIVGQKNREVIEQAMDKTYNKIAASVDAAHTVTYTGALSFEDILAVQKAFEMDYIPQADRSLDLTVDQFYELLQDPKVLPMYASGLNVVQTGDFVQIAGIKIYKRPTVATVGGKSVGLAYHKSCVGAAVTSINTFYREKDPLYVGDILTNSMWMGAGVLRTDKKGVIVLAQA